MSSSRWSTHANKYMTLESIRHGSTPGPTYPTLRSNCLNDSNTHMGFRAQLASPIKPIFSRGRLSCPDSMSATALRVFDGRSHMGTSCS